VQEQQGAKLKNWKTEKKPKPQPQPTAQFRVTYRKFLPWQTQK